jgi:hypothetical protein
MTKDWRLRNQQKFLQGVPLVFQQYAPASVDNDHDHCEFCFAKFMNADLPDVLRSGYTTADQYRWICTTCFKDFVGIFHWQSETPKNNRK